MLYHDELIYEYYLFNYPSTLNIRSSGDGTSEYSGVVGRKIGYLI